MFASIQSRDWNNSGQGRTFDIDTSLRSPATTGMDGSHRYIEFTATELESLGSGRRGGAVRDIERILTLRFTESDLRWLMEQAAAAGMFPAPGMAELQAAHAALSECVARLRLIPAGQPDA